MLLLLLEGRADVSAHVYGYQSNGRISWATLLPVFVIGIFAFIDGELFLLLNNHRHFNYIN